MKVANRIRIVVYHSGNERMNADVLCSDGHVYLDNVNSRMLWLALALIKNDLIYATLTPCATNRGHECSLSDANSWFLILA